jgi:hypothetical protein
MLRNDKVWKAFGDAEMDYNLKLNGKSDFWRFSPEHLRRFRITDDKRRRMTTNDDILRGNHFLLSGEPNGRCPMRLPWAAESHGPTRRPPLQENETIFDLARFSACGTVRGVRRSLTATAHDRHDQI